MVSCTSQFLIVDDHAGFRQVLADYLGLSQEQYRESCNGLEAIVACEQQVPDVILMDLEMPEMDGLVATQKLRGRYPDLRIIIVTQFHNQAIQNAALSSGAEACVLKDELSTLNTLLK